MKPIVDRPDIPAEYSVATDRTGLLEWSLVARVLAQARLYWIATSSARSAHLVPIHAAYTDGVLSLAGDPNARWYRNLTRDSRLQVGVSDGTVQVVARGRAEKERPGPDRFTRIAANIASKYDWGWDDAPELWSMRPTTVLAFDEAAFATSPTRFRFEEQP